MARSFGAYELIGELAQGGQGSVWRARHGATGQEVALKVLAGGGPDAAVRLAQEARVLAALSHPNIVGVFDHGAVEGRPFLACELVAGEDLAARARRGLPPPAWTVQALVAVARALQHCHERGVVHRDVKPANIVIEANGERPVLVDFGLVKRDPAQLGLTSIDERGELSLSGSMKGTPEYMAPEQIHPRWGAVGPWTDVYGLGATLFFLLTGRAPFHAESLPALLRKVTRQPPDAAALDPARVPPALARVCLQALQKDPRARFPTAEAFAQALRATGLVSDGGDVRRTSSGRLLAALQGPAKAGQRIGPFTVVRELGRGAMGVVFEARGDDGRAVALKLLTAVTADERVRKRFAREAGSLEKLDHANIVRFAGASLEGTPWLAMEFVVGRDLQAHLEHGKPAWSETARWVAQVARAVAHAHGRGVFHRDLKPSNVLVRDEDRTAVVTDFGLARSLEASKFTRTGDTVGTLAYMAPEQVKGQRAEGPPADVWAIGAILYRCLTGEPPFAAESALGLAAQIVEGQLRRPRSLDPAIPADLEAVCLACLQVDPAARPSAQDVGRALAARKPIGAASPLLGRHAVLAPLALVAGLIVVSALALAARRHLPTAPPPTEPAPAATATEPTSPPPSTEPAPAAPPPTALSPALGALPAGKRLRLVETLGAPHEGAVKRVQADGARVLAVSKDGVATVREGPTLVATLGQDVRDAALLVDGRGAAAGHEDGTLSIWELVPGVAPRREVVGTKGDPAPRVLLADWREGPGGQRRDYSVFWAAEDGNVRRWLLGAGQLASWSIRTDDAVGLRSMLVGLVTAGPDHVTYIADDVRGAQAEGVTTLTSSASRAFPFTGHRDGSVRLWRLPEVREGWARPLTAPITGLACGLEDDDRLLLATDQGGGVTLLDLLTGRVLDRLDLAPAGDFPTAVTFTSRDRAVVGTERGALLVVSIAPP